MALINGEKLQEIQEMALEFNRKLITDPNYGAVIKRNGGFLLLGNHYGVSSKLYFGLNPGGAGEGYFDVCPLCENGPWEIEKATGESVALAWKNKPSHKGYRPGSWVNCSRCFGSNTFLYDWPSQGGWMCDATSAFVIPWSTPSKEELTPLLSGTSMARYSRELVLKMVEHHDPAVIIATGPSCWKYLRSFLGIQGDLHYVLTCAEGNKKYPGANGIGNNQYQWGKLKFGSTTVFMVPHFARANNTEALKDCASWLKSELC